MGHVSFVIYVLIGIFSALLLGALATLGPVGLLVGEFEIVYFLSGIVVVSGAFAFYLHKHLALPASPFFRQVLGLVGLLVFFWACGTWAARELLDVENYIGNNETYWQQLPQEITPQKLREQMQETYEEIQRKYER